ncbi:MAG: hypothetical protein IJS68_01505 [Clostridia bacterium]|nr:hypothetical protein [Clostridia bacterium]
MSKSEFKILVQKAKNRLKTISQNYNEQEKTTKSAGLSLHQYALIATNIKIEDDPLYKKVEKCLRKTQTLLPQLANLLTKNISAILTKPRKNAIFWIFLSDIKKLRKIFWQKNFQLN